MAGLLRWGRTSGFLKGAYWDFFDHHLALTEFSVNECLETAGFQSKYVLDRFLPYTMVNAPHIGGFPAALFEAAVYVEVVWETVHCHSGEAVTMHATQGLACNALLAARSGLW